MIGKVMCVVDAAPAADDGRRALNRLCKRFCRQKVSKKRIIINPDTSDSDTEAQNVELSRLILYIRVSSVIYGRVRTCTHEF